MELKFNVQTRILKPVAEVFDAVYNPNKLSGYFTTGGASAPLDEGTTVQWAFADNPGDEKHTFPVTVTKVIPNELIVLGWEGAKGLQTRVEMKFEASGNDTIVRIEETGWRERRLVGVCALNRLDGDARIFQNVSRLRHLVLTRWQARFRCDRITEWRAYDRRGDAFRNRWCIGDVIEMSMADEDGGRLLDVLRHYADWMAVR